MRKSANGDISMKIGVETHYTTTIYNQPWTTWNSTIFQDGYQLFKMAATGVMFWTISLCWDCKSLILPSFSYMILCFRGIFTKEN